MKLVRSTLLTLASGIAFYGAWAVFAPAKASAYFGVCCTYGQDCAGFAACNLPTSGQADCSPDNKNYCSSSEIM